MNKKIVIIGAGIGGLSTGYLLARKGYDVVLLDNDYHPGGSLQSFMRDGIRFDTGFHFIGGMSPRCPLYGFFRELGLLDLPWISIDTQEEVIDGEKFSLPSGQKQWYKYLAEKFPNEKEALLVYLNKLAEVTSCPMMETIPYWEKNAWEWLCETIKDEKLRNVLSGSALILELKKDSLPLFAYAEIMNSFISSCHRLADGGQPIIDHLSNGIVSAGGEIRCHSTVTRIAEKDGHVTGVVLSDGEVMDADIVISSINPVETMGLLSDDSSMRGVYRRRVTALDNSLGCFTVNIKVTHNAPFVGNIPLCIHRKGSDLWNVNTERVNHLFLHFYPEQDAFDIIIPMSWDRVKRWDGTKVGNRGEDYEKFKQEIIDQCLDLAEEQIPSLRDYIVKIWSSSPLTWRSYLLSHNGSSYGVRKDSRSVETTLLNPRTPMKGLYLTGQSIILHGIMGTIIAAFQTAASIDHSIPSWPNENLTYTPNWFLE